MAFGPVALADRVESYTFGRETFSFRSGYSTPLYVRFPVSVHVDRAFAPTISTDDTTFSWPVKAGLGCDDVEQVSMLLPMRLATGASIIPIQPHVALLKSSGRSDSIGLAAKTSAFENRGCPAPFVGVSGSKNIGLDFPSTSRDNDASTVSIMVAVIVDAKGKVADDGLLLSSGNEALDRAAERVAEQSTYTPAISRCKPVPSAIFFRADFTLDGS